MVCSDGVDHAGFSDLRVREGSAAEACRWVLADNAVHAVLWWLERELAVGEEVGWCLLEPITGRKSVCGDPDKDGLLVVGEAGASPAVVITGKGRGFGVEFRPRRSRADDYATLDESLDVLAGRLGGGVDVRAKRVAVVPRADSAGLAGIEWLWLSWVGEIHEYVRSGSEGRVRVWPMCWRGMLNQSHLAGAGAAAAGQRREWMERRSAAHPGRAGAETAARVFNIAEHQGGRTRLPVSCYNVDVGAGWDVLEDGGWRPWKSPLGPGGDLSEAAGAAAGR